MKKLLICIVIGLVIILTGYTAFNGIHVGSLNILGIQEIKKEDTNLENKLAEATKLASTEYPSKITTINSDIKAMQAEKQKYEDMVAVSTESEIALAMQKEKYTIDKLWAKLGTLATDEGLDAKFELTAGTLTAAASDNFKYYNIGFTVEGSYVGVSLYISDLEDDSELNFKIEDFKMEPTNSGETVRATFTTKDIAITGISGSNISSDVNNEPEKEIVEETETKKQNTSILNSINSATTDLTRQDRATDTID